MPLTSSGQISLNDVHVEVRGTSGTQSALNDSVKRTLAGRASGQIALSDFYDKEYRIVINITISSNTQNYNLYNVVSANSAYISGITDVNLTINSNVYVGSTSTSTPALDLNGSWNSGDRITIVNNGYILGKGGNGNTGLNNGLPGGVALRQNGASQPQFTKITNNGTIGGGGGSGAQGYGFGSTSSNILYQGGGGGAGYSAGTGGQHIWAAGYVDPTSGTTTNGGSAGGSSMTYPNLGKAGGSAGNAGASGTLYQWNYTYHSSGTCYTCCSACCPSSGSCASGCTSDPTRYCTTNQYYSNGYWVRDWRGDYYFDDQGYDAGGGGGLGAAGGSSGTRSGGAGGAATAGTANITWITTGTRYGTIG